MVTGATCDYYRWRTIHLTLKKSLREYIAQHPDVYGIAGKTYTLNIKLAAQIGGYTDYTASSTLYPVNPLDSIGLAFHPEWSDRWNLGSKMLCTGPSNVDFYRFLISKNGKCLQIHLMNGL